jgi:hypothetical protein
MGFGGVVLAGHLEVLAFQIVPVLRDECNASARQAQQDSAAGVFTWLCAASDISKESSLDQQRTVASRALADRALEFAAGPKGER